MPYSQQLQKRTKTVGKRRLAYTQNYKRTSTSTNQKVVATHRLIKGPEVNVDVSDATCFGQIDRKLQLDTRVRLGRGAFGSVYQVCDRISKKKSKSNCGIWVAKLVPLFAKSDLKHYRASEEDFRREAQLTRRLSNLGVGVTVLGWRVCRSAADPGQKIGIIVMERLDTTVKEFAQKHPNEYVLDKELIDREVSDLLDTLAINRLRHRDLHTQNVMLKLKRGTNRVAAVFLVDAGGIQSITARSESSKLAAIDYAHRTWEHSKQRSISKQLLELKPQIAFATTQQQS